MTSRKLSVLVVASALSMAGGAALAQQQGNADAGKQKSSMCAGCHGIPGYRTAFPETYTVPKIGGQHASYIVKALQGYKSGDRKHPSMRAIAASLTDQDMADIAAYYATTATATAAK